MKFDSMLKSNHDLKKNGYKVLRKLHKLEKKNGAELAYSKALEESYGFVLSCQALIEIIYEEYGHCDESSKFLGKCESFLSYLETISKTKSRINSKVLSSFLHSYTVFFNYIIKEKYHFVFNQRIIELWNMKCLMAYIATWGIQ